MSSIDKTLFDRLGGQRTLEKVHTIFYDKLYIHPWLGKFLIYGTLYCRNQLKRRVFLIVLEKNGWKQT